MMTIKDFIKRWEPVDEHEQQQFNQEFWSIIDKLGEDRFRQVAIEVLGDIEGSVLKIDKTEDGNRIVWGDAHWPEETGWIVYYSGAIGQHGSDWLMLLKSIAASALKQTK